MSYNGGHHVRSRQPTLLPTSNRTLHHPSFLPLYQAADCTHHHTDQTVHPITPADFFYSDPTMSRGTRIPNIVRELRVFDCFQLNTPPPVMSACLVPPARPDPFRFGPHPTRDLGSLTFKVNTLHPPVQPNQVVLQLTQEEDQAITNLLKLHHQPPVQIDEPEPMDCSDHREASLPSHLQPGRCWSDTELEAANTLLSRFSLMEEDQIWGLPDPLPHQRQGSETSPVSVTNDCTQNDKGFISFSCVRESGEPGWGDFIFVEEKNADDVHLPVNEEYLGSSSPSREPLPDSKAKSRSSVSREGRMLTDSEGDAVHVLLSLGDMGALQCLS